MRDSTPFTYPGRLKGNPPEKEREAEILARRIVHCIKPWLVGHWKSNLTTRELLVKAWSQTLVGGAKCVQIGDEKYPVRETARRRLKQVDFSFQGKELRGLEQNPETKSRWAKMAREGKKVMQFLEGGRYVAVVVDRKMKTYG